MFDLPLLESMTGAIALFLGALLAIALASVALIKLLSRGESHSRMVEREEPGRRHVEYYDSMAEYTPPECEDEVGTPPPDWIVIEGRARE